jgi:hypothetical protein
MDTTQDSSQDTGCYDVVLLVEQELATADAAQVRALHEELEDSLCYHVLMPVEDAASRVEAAMGSLAAGEVIASPGLAMGEEDLRQIQSELLEHCRSELDTTVARLRSAGTDHPGRFDVVGDVVAIDPIEALTAKVAQVGACEAIILTRPHVVAEFFHLDWTSRARRKVGVPVLHLLEHEEG